jgi:hypothetical protein
MKNEIIRGKLLSEDGELTLIVLALDPDIVASSRLRDVTGEIQKTINDDLAGAQLTARLSGVPVMQLEIRNAVERDRLFYNAFGFAAGCLIAVVFFRRLSFMIIGAGPPLIASSDTVHGLCATFAFAQKPRIAADVQAGEQFCIGRGAARRSEGEADRLILRAEFSPALDQLVARRPLHTHADFDVADRFRALGGAAARGLGIDIWHRFARRQYQKPERRRGYRAKHLLPPY